jgi:hypothetical protein
MEKVIILTNNKLSYEKFKDKHKVVFIEGTLLDVMTAARDYIHKGHVLLTHPLSGSVKPNQTPYKTIAISLNAGDHTDVDSVLYIENSIETAKKLLSIKSLPDWPESVKSDFRLIDFDLIYHALN